MPTRTADLRDGSFRNQSGAVFVIGHWGDSWIDQFAGAGPSSVPYSFKAIMVDGLVFIPEPAYAWRVEKKDRDYSRYPIVRARVQPDARFIIKA
jgi:hypothetical protein